MYVAIFVGGVQKEGEPHSEGAKRVKNLTFLRRIRCFASLSMAL